MGEALAELSVSGETMEEALRRLSVSGETEIASVMICWEEEVASVAIAANRWRTPLGYTQP